MVLYDTDDEQEKVVLATTVANLAANLRQYGQVLRPIKKVAVSFLSMASWARATVVTSR